MGDLLYEFAQWLRETPLLALAEYLSETGMSGWLVQHFWIIPLLQTAHILALTMFFGSVLLLVLRIFGRVGKSQTVVETSYRFVPWQRGALAALALSGLLLIIAEPERELVNPIFWIKMALIVVTILITWVHHRSLLQFTSGAIDAAMKGRAALLLLLWCVVILCGRWIAYSPV